MGDDNGEALFERLEHEIQLYNEKWENHGGRAKLHKGFQLLKTRIAVHRMILRMMKQLVIPNQRLRRKKDTFSLSFLLYVRH